MYAERALNSIEALLFDRYRTYTWINFHHRVVTVKLLTRFLIQKLIERRTITPEHFAAKDNEELMLRNDVWLWNLLQELDPQGDREAALAKRALLSRRKNLTLSLWRNRLGYEAALDGMREKLPVPRWREFRIPGDIPEEEYGRFLTERMKTKAFVFYTAFNPIGSEPVWLYNVRDMKPVGKHLLEASELLSNLRDIWLREPQFYVQLLKDPISRDEESKWLKQWSIATADWFLPRWR
jgi:HD superfamily phosphohydrolase